MNSTIYDVAIIGGGQAGLCLALQLKQAITDLKILIIEKNSHPLPAAAHKVGESVVEVSSYYMNEILGLKNELMQEVPKFGLRFFFTGSNNTDIQQRFELGTSHYLPMPTFHIDRGSFETRLANKCKTQSIDFIDGCRASQIRLGADNQSHELDLKYTDNRQKTIQCTWLVDASSRASLLKRKLKLDASNRHDVNAAWFRIDHTFKLDTWSQDPDWLQRVREPRHFSTNHFMGKGYWLWFIPLANNRTSIGIVAESRHHPLSDINTLDKAMAWIEHYEPQCAALIKPQLNKVMDFKFLKKFSHDAKQVFSSNRWCLTGEAGVFLDPLYSPGGDFIGISNKLVSEIILRHYNGEDIAKLSQDYERIYHRLYRIFLSIYHRQYPIMGNTRIMSLKIIWDFSIYWGCVALLFCSQKLHNVAFMNKIDSVLSTYGFITIEMQKFFREWEKIDSNPSITGFLDYSKIDFVAKLNANLLNTAHDDSHIHTQLEYNLKLMQEVQQEIFFRVGQILPELAQPTNVQSNHLSSVFSVLDME